MGTIHEWQYSHFWSPCSHAQHMCSPAAEKMNKKMGTAGSILHIPCRERQRCEGQTGWQLLQRIVTGKLLHERAVRNRQRVITANP